MISALYGKNRIAMVGKTSKDPYGLWKLPIDALIHAGVNTNFINILSFNITKCRKNNYNFKKRGDLSWFLTSLVADYSG